MQHHTLPHNLWFHILIGMIVGIGIALSMEIAPAYVPWIALPGDLFIAILKMVIVPLVLSSVILGV